MAESALSKKLKLKPGQRAAILGAPPGYLAKLKLPPAGASVASRLSGKYDWIQLFVKTKAELARQLPKTTRALKPESLIWLTFPKGTSKIQTALTRDQGWEAAQGLDLKWVTLVSVDDTWSAFALRPCRPGEARQSFR